MSLRRQDGEIQPGINWGPFTLRIPFVHAGFELPEFLQGVLVSAATGLALVPVFMGSLGLTFEEAVLMSTISAFLIGLGPILFGEPYAAGWITPALPFVLAFVLNDETFPTNAERFQAMTAMALDLAIILIVLGVTGLGKTIVEKIPPALKGAIIMGAAIAALKRVFLDDAPQYLNAIPYSMWTAMGVCLLLAFSVPLQSKKLSWPWLAKFASLGLLPGFLFAAVVGYFTGELSWVDDAGKSIVQTGIMTPPFGSLFDKVSPFALGFPGLSVMFNPDVLSLAFIGYIILFGDIVTGQEILRGAETKRDDEKLDFNSTRTHLSTGIRNAIMAVTAPMFPTQGSLWTGVHVIIVNRWAEGRKSMDSLFSGIFSYYFFGVPILYFFLPLSTGLIPLLPIALALTLVMTGFACAYVAMDIPRNPIERGVILFGGVALAIFDPMYGLATAVLATFLLLGFKHEHEESLLEEIE
jgi:hypothetical protein